MSDEPEVVDERLPVELELARARVQEGGARVRQLGLARLERLRLEEHVDVRAAERVVEEEGRVAVGLAQLAHVDARRVEVDDGQASRLRVLARLERAVVRQEGALGGLDRLVGAHAVGRLQLDNRVEVGHASLNRLFIVTKEI